MNLLRTIVCVIAAALAGGAAAADIPEVRETADLEARINLDPFKLPAPARLGAPLQLWATWYWRYAADETEPGFALLDLQGGAISPPIAARARCEGALQGSIGVEGALAVRRIDGTVRTYSYAGYERPPQLDCRHYYRRAQPWMAGASEARFRAALGPFGDAADGHFALPYRGLAVDRDFIALGTVLFIPAARGRWITMPDGRRVRHDGYFIASDAGGAIHEHHIDVFTGISPDNPFPNFIKSRAELRFAAYRVSEPRVLAHFAWLQGRR